MKHIGTLPIECERLLLRRFCFDDIEPFFRNMASDVEAIRFLNWSPHKNTYATKNAIERFISDYSYPDGYVWCIEKRDIGESIGAILVTHVDSDRGTARVGDYLGSSFWGRGYMTEALHAVIDYLFCRVGLIYIECEHDLRNAASGRVMEKCGMRLIRKRKNAAVNNMGICDTAVYGIYYSEYEERKERERENGGK